MLLPSIFLNRKHEMFLNAGNQSIEISIVGLNRKHEMFLNLSKINM